MVRVTPPEVFFDRRRFLKALGPGLAAIAQGRASDAVPTTRTARYRLPTALPRKDLTPQANAVSHNYFSEFLPGRGGAVVKHVAAFEPYPWKVEVWGECERPRAFDLNDLAALGQEERVYHFRCVERWAMNVPWRGFPLRRLLEKVEPRSSARYVRFVSALRPEEMPGVRIAPYLPWPYREGLRLDEAMHDLAFVATGVYGEPLPKQQGAPVRIIVPWKYGFKSPKSVVHIELTRERPDTFWTAKPHEYGFLANVNPNVPHPRWSQQWSYWVDTGETFPTLLFNGYQEEVSRLYPDEPRAVVPPLRPGEVAR